MKPPCFSSLFSHKPAWCLLVLLLASSASVFAGAPSVGAEPSSTTVTVGATANFTVQASTFDNPSIQWQRQPAAGGGFSNLTNNATYSNVSVASVNGSNNTLTLFVANTTLAMSGDQFRALLFGTIGGAFSFNSTIATLTVSNSTAPAITTQPSNSTVLLGGNTTFTAGGNGTPAPTVQWQKAPAGNATFVNLVGGAHYSNVTSTVLMVTNATLGEQGDQYQAVFTNSAGNATSNSAVLTVDAAPAVTTQPANSTVLLGGNTTFTAGASGNPTPTVQWQKAPAGNATFVNLVGGAHYSNVTSTVLMVTNATLGEQGDQYQAVFTNSVGNATSNITVLTVDAAPAFTLQPANTTLTAGANVTFTTVETGFPAPTLQWQSAPAGNSTFSNLTNAGLYSNVTGSALIITNATASLLGVQYQLFAYNSIGNATSSVATLTVNTAPTFSAEPTAQTSKDGGSATFTVTAAGVPTPTYQWQVEAPGATSFTNIPGATSATLSLASTPFTQTGTLYRVVITNAAGTLTSNAVALTITPVKPYILSQSPTAGLTMAQQGSTVRLTVTAGGTTPLAYAWQHDGKDLHDDTKPEFSGLKISGAKSATLVLKDVQFGDTGKYRVVITNAGGLKKSASVVLNVQR